MAFPLDFGFIPSTLGEDGDPIDILILSELQHPLPGGCLVEVRLLGVIEAEQTQDGKIKRNDRLIARLDASRSFVGITELSQLGTSFCAEVGDFFVTYNRLKDRKFTVLQTSGAERAASLVDRGSC